PLRPDTAKKLHQLYLAKGVLATTAIEGNTLSEEEVLRHLQGTLKLPPSREYLAREIDNIVTGCNLLLSDIKAGRVPALTSGMVKKLNQIVLDKLKLDEEVMPGEIRGHAVGVGRYQAPPAQDCEYLLDRLCEWLNSEAFNPQPETVIVYAILKAVLAHLYLAWIHPFGDGNGRTARLVEFQILIASGVPAPAAHLLSNHYNQTRTEYYRQLDQASRSGGDALPFVLYATQGLLDGLQSQLQNIRDQQLDVAWRNYVHEAFSDKKSPSDARRRHLVLDLSQSARPLPLSELSGVSPRIAAAYARKTAKTLSRDVKALIRMGLLVQVPGGFRACKDRILAFLPPRAETLND
ncbi:MAG TPA: Fic family protein, partial [Patescibacteria group bacterium]|nr:Fic family protein [Patescibacteria group bacterium]